MKEQIPVPANISRLSNGFTTTVYNIFTFYNLTPYIFVTERGGPMTDSNVRKMVKRAGENAKIVFLVHPHSIYDGVYLFALTACAHEKDARIQVCRVAEL